MSKPKLFTIGHSNRNIDEFIELLQLHGVTAIADVRSNPYSQRMPHFNREGLKKTLLQNGIAYVFLGEELGARRRELECYVNGKAKYELIKATPSFNAGLRRIHIGLTTHCIALMCAEKDPITCHRTILVAKALKDYCDIHHIVSPDDLEPQERAEQRLMRIWQVRDRNLFQSYKELLEDAYQKQAEAIAYIDKDRSHNPIVSEVND